MSKNMTNKEADLAVERAISRAEHISVPGVSISAWCDWGGADDSSAPIVCRISLEDSDEFEQFPPKRERVEAVVKALFAVGIHAVDHEKDLGRYVELYHNEEIPESAGFVKICGFAALQ